MLTDLNSLLTMLPIFIVSISLHEFGHALMGHLCGDDTAEKAGRLTINPLAHLDLFGTLPIVLIGFGWAKPVPFDPRNLKHPRWQAPLIAAAGPLVNLLLLTACLIGYRMSGPGSPFVETWRMGVFINAMLVVFNMIPIPPLDGSLILRELLPTKARESFDGMTQFSWIFLMVALYLPATQIFMRWSQNGLIQGLDGVVYGVGHLFS
ncbi:MAG: site-2 protease family protein [Candidatus Sericytochromatia bacterium]|nr:site-2 protease family protein [Candidatus Sericytochromatia bacterium]